MTDTSTLVYLLQPRKHWHTARLEVDVLRNALHIFVSHEHGTRPCPTCGSACQSEEHAADRNLRHLDPWQAKTWIHDEMLRTNCSEHVILRVAVPWSDPSGCFSRAFEDRCAAAKAFSMDMWEPCRLAVERAFPVPQLDVSHDRFNMVWHANKALNAVYKSEVRHLARGGRQDQKGKRQAVLFGAKDLPEPCEASAELKASELRAAKGFALKQNLLRCWNHRLERTARAHFKSWISWIKRSSLSRNFKVANMIKGRLGDLVGYFRHSITNGHQEWMNSELISVIRAGRGSRTHETFRMAALFFLGRLDMTPRWRHA